MDDFGDLKTFSPRSLWGEIVNRAAWTERDINALKGKDREKALEMIAAFERRTAETVREIRERLTR